MPSETYAERNYSSDGVLYKALSTGSFDYLGDDPTLYETAFGQETGEHHQDLKPLIGLLKWAAGASDAELAAELDQHVDVESLAGYLALQELLGNFDDMAGPGKNYYLWYDLDAGKFTILTWYLNLALAETGRDGPEGRGFGGMTSHEMDVMMSCVERVRGEQGKGDGRGGMRMGHPLKDRFLATPQFQATYAQQYGVVYDALFACDQALNELDRLASVVWASALADAATLDQEVSALRGKLESQATRGRQPAPQAMPETPDTADTAAATPVH